MSTSNIIHQTELPFDLGYVIVFAARRGTMTYLYTSSEGAAIASGMDPSGFSGTRIESISDVFTAIGKQIPEAAVQAVTEALAEFL